jgi:hypothetical protein
VNTLHVYFVPLSVITTFWAYSCFLLCAFTFVSNLLSLLGFPFVDTRILWVSFELKIFFLLHFFNVWTVVRFLLSSFILQTALFCSFRSLFVVFFCSSLFFCVTFSFYDFNIQFTFYLCFSAFVFTYVLWYNYFVFLFRLVLYVYFFYVTPFVCFLFLLWFQICFYFRLFTFLLDCFFVRTL